jgi:hypothetical protein
MANLPANKKDRSKLDGSLPTDGDPLGRRLARHRANLLAEAGRVARAVEVLLCRAQFDATPLQALIKDLGEQERIELMRSHGRIEPRTRFKRGTSHPLLAGWGINAFFLDECGKSHPDPKGTQVFTLAGIAMNAEDTDAYREAADKLKTEFFAKTTLSFHEPNMRNHEGPFFFGGDSARQKQFDDALDTLVANTPFVAFGVGVRKDALAEYFVENGLDPYLPNDAYSIAMILLLERYLDFLAHDTHRLGRLTLESQGPKEDALHQLDYARVLLDGSQWVSASSFQGWLETGLRFVTKHRSDPTELADMFARDTFEWVRAGCCGSPRRWDIFASKIYCRGDGQMGKFGLKVFPDADIRSEIESHRDACRTASGR